MAVKSGFSHALATLLLTIISSLLVYFLRYVGIFEKIFEFLLLVSGKVSSWFEYLTGIEISYGYFPVIFVASLLAFIWGMIFHITRNR